MSLQALIAAGDLPLGIAAQIDTLIEAKRRTNERANGARLLELDALIRDELGRAGELPAMPRPPGIADLADGLFLDLVNQRD